MCINFFWHFITFVPLTEQNFVYLLIKMMTVKVH